MLVVIGQQDSIARQYLLELRDRDIQQDRARFRQNLSRLGEIMAYEISRRMTYSDLAVETPLAKSNERALHSQPVLITIMRAGLPYFDGFQRIFDAAECGFVGAYRQESGTKLVVQLDYLATPSLEGRDVILVDPMLATGNSITDAVSQLRKRGEPKHLHLASVVASPEGIRHVDENVTLPHTVWTFAVDEKLNHKFYIVPGLGDAGDLSFGPKS